MTMFDGLVESPVKSAASVIAMIDLTEESDECSSISSSDDDDDDDTISCNSLSTNSKSTIVSSLLLFSMAHNAVDIFMQLSFRLDVLLAVIGSFLCLNFLPFMLCVLYLVKMIT